MKAKKSLDILIFGTGAVGSTLGWRLAQNARTRVSVVCRSNYDAVKSRGITLQTRMWGDGHFSPVRVVRSPREVGDMTFDYVVCSNKISSLDSWSAIRDLQSAVSDETTLVSAQNGVGVEAPLHRAFPGNTILSAICYISCVQSGPSLVRQVSNLRPNAFHVGLYASSAPDAGELSLRQFIDCDAGFKSIENVQLERWSKQLFNGAWNPVSAISGLDTHSILASPYLQTVLDLATEMHDLALRLGVPLAQDMPAQMIETARNSPSLTPSMLQDAKMKRPMEVESLCGNISRLADSIGMHAPTIKRVYHTLLEMNNRCIGGSAPEPAMPKGIEHVLANERSTPRIAATP